MLKTDTIQQKDFIFNLETYVAPEELRVLSLSLMDSILNQAFCDSIETGLSKRRINDSLINVWSISDEESAKFMIEWLLYNGHSEHFDKIRDKVLFDGPANLEICQTEVGHNEKFLSQYLNYIENVRTFFRDFNEFKISKTELSSGIKAWDISRAVFVARLCREIGYVSMVDFEKYAQTASMISKKTYNNWSSFGKAYLLGRAMSLPDHELNVSIEVFYTLMNDQRSIWKRVGWFR